MSFAKVEIYIDSIAGPWLLPPTFFTRWYMLDWMNLILTSLSTSCSGGYIEGCSHFPFFPQHPHVPFPGAEHFTISPIWSGHVSSLPGLQKDFFKDFRSLYSIYIWMHVISAWLFSVSISRLTLGKRCSCNNFSPKEDFVTWGDRILSYFVIFLLQVTLEITVLMSLTFFMNMVSSNKNQKVKMRPWL